MGMILIAMTFFAAVMIGSVILIQLGGWLAIMAAILILIHYFMSVFLASLCIASEKASKRKKEELK